MNNRKFFLTGCAIFASLSVGSVRDAHAGWSGLINGLGFGRASVNVTSEKGNYDSAGIGNVYFPSAGMAITAPSGFTVSKPDPANSSSYTLSTATANSGYKFTARTVADGGDRTDNDAILSYLLAHPEISFIPQNLAQIFLQSSIDPSNPNLLILSGLVTGGAAYLFQSYLWTGTGDPTEQDLDNIGDNDNFHQVFESPIFGVGEGELDPTSEGGTIRRIEFPYDLTDPAIQSKLYMTFDGYAESPVPESGPMILAFGLSVLGLLSAHRVIRPAGA